MRTLRPREPRAWLRAGIFLLFALLPVSMPGHLFVNHFLKKTWCWYSAFLYPEFFVLLLIGAVNIRILRQGESPPAARKHFELTSVFFVLGLAIVVWTSLSAVLQGAYADYWIQRLFVGWVFPMCTALVLLMDERQEALRAAWQGLAAGVSVLLVVCLVLYVVSFGVPRSFHELVFVNRTWKAHLGISGGILFGVLTLGNFNDVAVFFAGAIAVACGALARPGRERRVTFFFLTGALLLEYLCYSRGVILSLVLLLLLILACGRRWKVRPLVGPGLLLTGFLVTAVIPKDVGNYWKEQLTVASGSTAKFRADLWSRVLSIDPNDRRFEGQIPASTYEAGERLMLDSGSDTRTDGNQTLRRRGRTRSEISDEFRALRRRTQERVGSPRRVFWLGYGSGNNGLIQGMTYDAGTHNLFLDALGASGVVGLVLVGVLWLVLLAVTARLFLAGPSRALIPGTGLVTALGLFAVCALLFVNACLVNWRIDNLGTSLNATVFWLLVATACAADRGRALGLSDPAGAPERIEGR